MTSSWDIYASAILACIEKRHMESQQIVAIVHKVRVEEPNEWDYSMLTLASSALYEREKDEP